MALASINASREAIGRGNLYLIDYPTTQPTGANLAAILVSYFNKFYTTAGTMKGTMTPSVYCNLEAAGLKITMKKEGIKSKPLNNAEHTIGYKPLQIEGEFTFIDVDPAHIRDAFSADATEAVSIAAASGKAGRDQALLGSGSAINRVTMLYKMASPLFAGEFDHLLLTRVVLEPDFEFNYKDEAVVAKVKFTAEGDPYLLNAATGLYEYGCYDVANAAGL